MNKALLWTAKGVLYIDKSTLFGGAEECLLALMLDIDQSRFQPSLCLDQPMSHHTPFKKNIFDIHYRIKEPRWWSKDFSGGVPVGLGHFQRFMYAIKLRNILRLLRPSIVHLNLYRHTAYLDLYLARRSGAIVISHVRSLANQMIFKKKVLDLCDGIICTSEIVRQEVAGSYLCGNVRRIYDGVDCTKYLYHGTREDARALLQIPLNTFTLSSIAMLHSRKGHDTAIMAMPKIMKRIPSAVLLIAGCDPNGAKGTEKNRLTSLAESLGVADCVRFLGHCTDMSALYAATDIVLALSTDGEAFGRVPIEAACAGRPVIATALGATPEVVDADITGLLVSAGNSDAVAAAVIRLFDKPEVRADLAAHAGEKARAMFSSRAHAENVQVFYEELLQSASSSL